MPEARDLRLFRWGEEIRRIRADRRGRRIRTGLGLLACFSATAVAATIKWPPRPHLVWNVSTSAPIGLYLVQRPRPLQAGDLVIAWTPNWARSLAAARGYLPSNVPLVKRVAAMSGDEVCAAGEALYVNGNFSARRRWSDRGGRPLQWWNGCRRLRAGELFLLMEGEADSFDGRYFGLSETSDVVGKARLLWAR